MTCTLLRFLWRVHVPGNLFVVVGLTAILAVMTLVDPARIGMPQATAGDIAYCVVLLALNAYSYDYQRRRAAGEML